VINGEKLEAAKHEIKDLRAAAKFYAEIVSITELRFKELRATAELEGRKLEAENTQLKAAAAFSRGKLEAALLEIKELEDAAVIERELKAVMELEIRKLRR
jgi:catechol-2,3-dioxygenase